jgi:DNA polymerase II large subunit
MVEKLDAQLSLAKKIRAVDASDVAERVINLHFIKDLMGNLRAYATQQVRCTNCNAKYRRPTLSGRCTKCGSNLMPTVHEGTVRKYLEASLTVAQEYEISKYTRQRLRLLEAEIDSLFPKVELGDFSNRRLGNKIGVT